MEEWGGVRSENPLNEERREREREEEAEEEESGKLLV